MSISDLNSGAPEPQDNDEEVVHIGDPRTKPPRLVPFRVSFGGSKTKRQKRSDARTMAMISDPANIADDPPHIDTRSNKGRKIRRKRAKALKKKAKEEAARKIKERLPQG